MRRPTFAAGLQRCTYGFQCTRRKGKNYTPGRQTASGECPQEVQLGNAAPSSPSCVRQAAGTPLSLSTSPPTSGESCSEQGVACLLPLPSAVPVWRSALTLFLRPFACNNSTSATLLPLLKGDCLSVAADAHAQSTSPALLQMQLHAQSKS